MRYARAQSTVCCRAGLVFELVVLLLHVAAAARPLRAEGLGSVGATITVAGDGFELGLAGVDLGLTATDDTSLRPSTGTAGGAFAFTGLATESYLLSILTSGLGQADTAERLEPPQTEDRVHFEVDRRFEGTVAVTATRSERPTAQVPASISVVDRASIEATPRSNIADYLSGLPGTLVESRNQGYDARLVIRGAGLKARYGIREIMLLIDGMPVTDPDSFTRLDFVDPNLVERVEVVRGPGSTLWGVNATGGVVNFITRSPFDRQGMSARADLGAFGARSLHAAYSGSLGEKGAFNLDLSRRTAANSWRPWNEFTSSQLSAQPCFILGQDTVWESFLSFTDAELQLPGRLVVDPGHDVDQWSPYLATGEVARTAEPWRHSSRDSRVLFLGSRLTTRWGPFELKPQLHVNRWSHWHPVTGRINDADTLEAGLELQADWNHGWGTLTGGIGYRAERQDDEGYRYAEVRTAADGRIVSTLSDQPGELMRRVERRTTLAGVYLQEALRLGERWTVDLGLRADRIRFDFSGFEWLDFDYSGGRYEPGQGAIDEARAYTALSPRLGVVRRLGPHLHAFASASSGQQSPTSDELAVNPRLELTEVRSYEIGLKGRSRDLDFDAAVFFSPLRNEVVQVAAGFGETAYANAGGTDKRGLELAVQYRPGGTIAFGASYSYSHFVFSDFSEPVRGRDVERSGNRLPFVPTHQYGLSAEWRSRAGIDLRVASNTWGEYEMDNANSERYEGYRWVTELSVGYRGRHLELALMVQNLFDQRYAVEAQKDLYGSVRYGPAAPRAVLARVGWRQTGGAP